MDKTQERIKADAAKAYPLTNGNDLETGKRIGYLAGATAESERAQKLADALKYIQKFYDTKDISLSQYAAGLIKEYEQWKDGKKEVCTCDNIQLAAHGECWGCPGRDTKLTNPQK